VKFFDKRKLVGSVSGGVGGCVLVDGVDVLGKERECSGHFGGRER